MDAKKWILLGVVVAIVILLITRDQRSNYVDMSCIWSQSNPQGGCPQGYYCPGGPGSQCQPLPPPGHKTKIGLSCIMNSKVNTCPDGCSCNSQGECEC